MHVRNLHIIGTSHIARQSIKEITAAIDNERPGIIAIELDPSRLDGLLHPRKEKYRISDIRHLGITGYLFARIAAFAEAKLGESVGVKPGSEMKRAIHLARERNIPLALIDQDISITLKRLTTSITWREKLRFAGDIIKAFIFRKPIAGFDLTTVPDESIVDKLIDEVRVRYPNVYRTLITERNHVMSQRLAAIMTTHPDTTILAIVGAGHKRAMADIIEKTLARQALKTTTPQKTA